MALHVGVRVGVDVGGTFTKAVAVDLASGEIVGRAVVPTTHADARRRRRRGGARRWPRSSRSVGAERVDLVTHSTTQAVNALLEGDVGTVGVIGLGRRPDLQAGPQAHRSWSGSSSSPGRFLRTLPEFLDVTDGLRRGGGARRRWPGSGRPGRPRSAWPRRSRPTTPRNERRGRGAGDRGRPAGVRVQRADRALRPRAAGRHRRAQRVDPARSPSAPPRSSSDGVDAAGVAAPVMVMRGDGGATDLDGFRRAPARTLYSGPAASVAGALRFAGVADGVVVEVGGTSTNVAAIKRGRPAAVLRPGRQPRHRAAGRGRAGHRRGRRLDAAGAARARSTASGPGARTSPGCPTPASRPGEAFDGAHASSSSRPRPGDPADYLVVRPGRRAAAGADQHLRRQRARASSQPGDYAARATPPPRPRPSRWPAPHCACRRDEVARRMLEASGTGRGRARRPRRGGPPPRSARRSSPSAAAPAGWVATWPRSSAWSASCPPEAEVISSVGDALSLLRAERERTVSVIDPADLRHLAREVETELLAAGASPGSIEVRVDEEPEKGTDPRRRHRRRRAAHRGPAGARGRGRRRAGPRRGRGRLRVAGAGRRVLAGPA